MTPNGSPCSAPRRWCHLGCRDETNRGGEDGSAVVACREDGVGVAVQVTAANAATAPASCAEAGGAASIIVVGYVDHLPKEAGNDAKTAAESSSSSNSILPPFNKNIND